MRYKEPDLEGSDGYVRQIADCVTRRPRNERYFYVEKVEEMSRDWLLSIVSMVEAALDHRGVSLQDVADAIDYGPHQLAPRKAKEVAVLVEAFERSMAEQAEKCARGEHMMQNGRCWACKEPALQIVKDD